MATTKSKRTQRDNGGKPRRRSSKVRSKDDPPTPEELAEAVRYLSTKMSVLRRKLDKACASGKSDRDAWLAVVGYASQRPGVLHAVLACARRDTIPRLALSRSREIMRVSLLLARGEISEEVALKRAAAARNDGFLSASPKRDNYEEDLGKVRRAVATTRSERSRCQAVYNVLAEDADVYAPPDMARGRSEKQASVMDDALLVLAEGSRAKRVAEWMQELLAKS